MRAIPTGWQRDRFDNANNSVLRSARLSKVDVRRVRALQPHEDPMKTISIPAFGGPEQLQTLEMPQPRPAAGEALVKLDYAGLNFIDVYMRS